MSAGRSCRPVSRHLRATPADVEHLVVGRSHREVRADLEPLAPGAETAPVEPSAGEVAARRAGRPAPPGGSRGSPGSEPTRSPRPPPSSEALPAPSATTRRIASTSSNSGRSWAIPRTYASVLSRSSSIPAARGDVICACPHLPAREGGRAADLGRRLQHRHPAPAQRSAQRARKARQARADHDHVAALRHRAQRAAVPVRTRATRAPAPVRGCRYRRRPGRCSSPASSRA